MKKITRICLLLLLGACTGNSVQENHTVLGKWALRDETPSGPFQFIAHFRNDSTYDGLRAVFFAIVSVESEPGRGARFLVALP
ncbi:MAG: hypothetical protein QM664_01495, partial [Flavihumibacter sp.]